MKNGALSDFVKYTLKLCAILTSILTPLRLVKEIIKGESLELTTISLAIFTVFIFGWCIFTLLSKETIKGSIITDSLGSVSESSNYRYSRKERLAARVFIALIISCATTAFLIEKKLLNEQVFSKDDFGILVLQVDDDPSEVLSKKVYHSLEGIITRSLLNSPIKIHYSKEKVKSTIELKSAHQIARNIGKKYNAQLVLWGVASGEKTLFPRITIVNYTIPQLGIVTDISLPNQDLSQLNLPPLLESEYASLTYYVIGIALCSRNQYEDALKYFSVGLQPENKFLPLLPDYLFFYGYINLILGVQEIGASPNIFQNGTGVHTNFQQAALTLQQSSILYKDRGLLDYSARSDVFLAMAYRNLINTNNYSSETNSIVAGESAVQNLTATNNDWLWVAVQYGLCIDYARLQYSNDATPLLKAITAGEAALSARPRLKAFDASYNDVQNIIRHSCLILAVGGPFKNLDNGMRVRFGETALGFISVSNNFDIWALLHFSLANEYASFPSNNANERDGKVLFHCKQALTYYTETNDPIEWATLEAHLCDIYTRAYYGGIQTIKPSDTSMMVSNIENAIITGESALRVMTKSNRPEIWVLLENDLGIAYLIRPIKNRNENLLMVRKYCEDLLGYSQLSNYPDLYQSVSNRLVLANNQITIFTH